MFAIPLILSLLLPATASLAAVNDVMPGDYFPLQPGQTTLTTYAYDREFQGPYAGGRQTFDGRIDSSVLALRAARSFQVGDTTFADVAVLPWTDSQVSPAPLATDLGGKAKGLSDLRLGISGMLIAPTGDCDSLQVLNAGGNRWRYVLSAGWRKDITPRFLVELSPEIAFYGDNGFRTGREILLRYQWGF